MARRIGASRRGFVAAVVVATSLVLGPPAMAATSDLSFTVYPPDYGATGGRETSWVVEMYNFGPDDATGVQVLVDLPSGSVVTSAEVTGSVGDLPCSWVGTVVICSIPTFTTSQEAYVIARFVPPTTATRTTVSGSVQVSSDSTDPNGATSGVTMSVWPDAPSYRAIDLGDVQPVALADDGWVAATSVSPQHALRIRRSTTEDLGTVGGTSSSSIAVTSTGAVAGHIGPFGSAGSFFAPAGAAATALGALGGATTVASDMNDAGLVVGRSTTSAGASHAFTSNAGGALIDLGTLGGVNSGAHLVNDAGVVYGESQQSGGAWKPVRWVGGSPEMLSTTFSVGGSSKTCKTYWIRAVADPGFATGALCGDNLDESYPYAVVWNGTTPTALSSFTGGSEGVDVNDTGEAVYFRGGFCCGTPITSFYWSGGTSRPIAPDGNHPLWAEDDPPLSVRVEGMNGSGLAVGGFDDDGTFPDRGFVYDDAARQMYDLNDLLVGSPGVVVGHAIDINEDGEILAEGTVGGQPRALLLTAPTAGPTDSASGSVGAGGSVSTDAGDPGPSADDPVATSVTVPVPATVSIQETAAGPPPDGYELLGEQVQIDTDVISTADDPYVVRFALDGSLLAAAGADWTTVQVFRDGLLVPEPCAGPPGDAVPDPCLDERTQLPGGGVQLTVLSSHASLWTFAQKTPYALAGPFSPVDAPPVVNTVKAGRAIPVRFSLAGDQGLGVFVAGFPASVRVGCDGSASTDPIEQTLSVRESALTYDAATDTYTYVWSTKKAYAGSAGPCRELTLRFIDGSMLKASFRFA